MNIQGMISKLMVLMAICCYSTQALAQDPNFHIYLCLGQSNMEGHARFEAQDTVDVDERFQVMSTIDCSGLNRIKGQWYKAVPPLCRCHTGLTPADYFGRTLVAALPVNVRVGVINVAIGGCRIELFDCENDSAYIASSPDWLKNMVKEYENDPYGRLVEMARLAQNDGVIKGILLHQGESNTGDADWPRKVKLVYDNLMRDLGLDAQQVPLLAGEMVSAAEGGKCASMNSIIATLPQTMPNAYVISSDGCKGNADQLHFTAEGVRELGKRYGEMMLKLY